MLNSKTLDEISARINEAIAASPARDLQKNLRAMLASATSKLDLVSREEFEVQAQLLLRTREKLDALEVRVAALEAKRSRSPRKQG
jgi:BMFP domain-containing protein YqiC